MELFIEPHKEEERLHKQLLEARRMRDKEKIKAAEADLVTLYVQYGEHFKMSERPNRREAIRFLEKATKLIPAHSIANYRIAHLYYREKKYEKAALHFRNALESYIPFKLNDIQTYLSQLFLANSGILMAKNAVQLIEEFELEHDVDEEPLVARYRHEIIASSVGTIDRLYYRKLSKNEEQLIPYEAFHRLYEENPDDTVLLIIYEDGKRQVKLGELFEDIYFVDFLLLYTILRSDHPVTNTKICEKLFNYPEHQVKEDNVRKELSRLKKAIPFWDEMIETCQIDRKSGRKLKQDLKFFVLCSVIEQLPDELG